MYIHRPARKRRRWGISCGAKGLRLINSPFFFGNTHAQAFFDLC